MKYYDSYSEKRKRHIAAKNSGYINNMSLAPNDCRQIYESKIEALHFATIFKASLKDDLKWDNPIISTSYFPDLTIATDLAENGKLSVKEHDGVFGPYITRISQKGKKGGYYFRIVEFVGYGIAYLNGYDYVGDELNMLAAVDETKIKPFFEDVKKKYKEHIAQTNAGKLIIYTLERGNPRTHVVDMPQVTEIDMVADQVLLKDINDDLKSFFDADIALYEKFNIAHRRGIMFHGPPGCGKTLMCKYIAHKAKVPVVQFFASAAADTSDLLDFFNYMADISPAIVIFEDLDSLFKGDLARSNFLNILDGACTDKKLSLLVLATTNHIKEIDEALTQRPSRFDRHYLFGFPSAELRRQYVMQRFSEVKSFIGDEKLIETFVKYTEKMSFAHLNEIYTQAARKAIAAGKDKLSIRLIREAIGNVKKETGTDKGDVSFVKSAPLAAFKGDGQYIEDGDED
jgi:hypothetical protein